MEVQGGARPMEGLKNAYRVVSVIGYAMVGSVFIYAVVVEVLKRTLAPFEGFTPAMEIDTFRYVFGGVSVVGFFLIRIIKGRILSAKVPPTGAGPRSGGFEPHIQRLFLASIITFVISESVAIYGLILFLMAWNSADFYIFMLLSLVCFAVYFPRFIQWENWVRSGGGGFETPTGPEG
jgi:F0F1-type ATP synthase membrane subunit c/vacuolar-type H+-ATPase subunit K